VGVEEIFKGPRIFGGARGEGFGRNGVCRH
jgi:hypothetical protein